ncbi:hypothetical protein MASR1M65_15960 [Saprospiraceae bacterium]
MRRFKLLPIFELIDQYLKQRLMFNLLRNWDFMRVLRLALGLYVIVEGIRMHDTMLITLGGIFTLMPVFNIGCSAGGTCTPRYRERQTFNPNEDISYKEIK